MDENFPEDLVVVAAHGTDHIDKCLKSLGKKYPIKVVNSDDAEGYTTGKYLHAYRNFPAKNFFFMQDSMEALQKDFLEPFKREIPDRGAVAWALFPMMWDSLSQMESGYKLYSSPMPSHGIFGPIFYISRKSLEELEKKNLLPPVPKDKTEAQASERYWAWALQEAEMPIVGPEWRFDTKSMESGEYGIFKKLWKDRK